MKVLLPSPETSPIIAVIRIGCPIYCNLEPVSALLGVANSDYFSRQIIYYTLPFDIRLGV